MAVKKGKKYTGLMIYLYLKDSTFTAVKFQTSYVKGVPFVK